MSGKFLNFRGGINWQDHPHDLPPDQCVLMQNIRHRFESLDTIAGTIKYHGNSVGSDPITAMMPYHDEATGAFQLLVASGGTIYKKDPALNTLVQLQSGFKSNSIFSSADRFSIKYIASEDDTIYKFSGGTIIETVGIGATKPSGFRQVLYMKEVDRIFGIRRNAVLGQIGWCEFQDPETWTPSNVDRIKLQDGETTEWAEVLYGKLIIFNTYSIWIYYVSGNEENWRLEQAPVTVGCIAFRTIKRVGNEIWFLGESPKNVRGVYAFNGSTTRLLTFDINPLIAGINQDRIADCCAEIHDGFYTLSFPYAASTVNNMSIDLDSLILKEDGTPAVWGPHDISFYSSCVLDTVDNKKEVLYGDQADGFIYKEGGASLKSTNGIDGQLLRQRWLSAVYDEEKMDTMKQFLNIRFYFKPTGFFQAHLRAYFSYAGAGAFELLKNIQAVQVSDAGDFDAFERIIYGIPDVYEYWIPLGINERGTSIQFEVINDNIGQLMSLHGASYDSTDIYQTRGVQYES